ncbi:hypothetical protein ACH47C_06780 [Streptomyces rishiriensis]|uniref:hypothetical protein n=1 Tax=Streptomyces rishiriensis TaxID=68264 RepID=UPI0033FC393D
MAKVIAVFAALEGGSVEDGNEVVTARLTHDRCGRGLPLILRRGCSSAINSEEAGAPAAEVARSDRPNGWKLLVGGGSCSRPAYQELHVSRSTSSVAGGFQPREAGLGAADFYEVTL